MKEKNLPSAEDLATQNEQLRNELKFMKTEKRVTELLGRNPGEDFINDVIDYIYHNNLNPDSFFEIAKNMIGVFIRPVAQNNDGFFIYFYRFFFWMNDD